MSHAIEGLGTTLTVGSANLCYVTLQGLGIDGGEKLSATCLENSEWMTFLPQTLKSIPDLAFTASFKPQDWDAISAEINVNQQLTISYAYQGTSLGSITFWGYLKEFTPSEGAVGERWTASGTIVVTNLNTSNAETGPSYSA